MKNFFRLAKCPLYVVIRERDCDHFESITAHRFWTYLHFNHYITDKFRHAEGRVTYRFITRRQYQEFESSFIDHAAELAGY